MTIKPTAEDIKLGWNVNYEFLMHIQKSTQEQDSPLSLEQIDSVVVMLKKLGLLKEGKV